MSPSKQCNSGQTERKRCVYTDNDKAALVNFLIEAQDAGQQSDNNFKQVVWTKAASLLNQQLTGGHPKTADSCKQQYASVYVFFLFLTILTDFVFEAYQDISYGQGIA